MPECDYCGRLAATTAYTGEVSYGLRLRACPQCADQFEDEAADRTEEQDREWFRARDGAA